MGSFAIGFILGFLISFASILLLLFWPEVKRTFRRMPDRIEDLQEKIKDKISRS